MLAGSRRDQEKGGELDSHEEVRHFCGVQAKSKEVGELDSQESTSRAGRWSLAPESWTCLLLQLLLKSSATDIVLVSLLRTAVETAIAWYTDCWTRARGHCFNIVVILTAVHGLLGLRGRCTRSSLRSLSPPPPPPPRL